MNQKSIHQERRGASLKHGEAHDREHQLWSRRDFLSNSGLTALGASLMLQKFPVSAFSASPLLAALNASECGDRVLVLIRMEGGNDGLNTIIPRFNNVYYDRRPNIAIQESGLWALNGQFGMPLTTVPLQAAWNEGRMKVIHNVGYPSPNYSHFRSSDIWASASDANKEVNTGWIGRVLESQLPAFLETPPVVPPALQIGVQTNLIFRADVGNMALSLSNPTEFYQIAATGQLYNATAADSTPKELELSFARSVANSAFRYSESIKNAYGKGKTQATYPNNNSLGEQLGILARLIKGNLGTKIYMVTIGGFDTHDMQATKHAKLMTQLSEAVKVFFADLKAGGYDDKVLAMTFSEFGRRFYENDSKGTDHGTGAPMMLFGNGLGNGLVGTPSVLPTSGDNDPAFSTDFRSVYATVLKDWLCADPTVTDFVIGKSMPTISNLVPTASVPTASNANDVLLGHNPSETAGSIAIKYSIQQRGITRLSITDLAGHTLRTMFSEFKEKGSYTYQFNPATFYLPSGTYIYKLDTSGKTFSRQIEW